MSDNQNKNAKPADTPAEAIPTYGMSTEDIQRFLQNKWKNTKCEVCEQASPWILYDDPNRYSVFPLSDGNRIAIITSKALVGLNVSCRNCGNFKFLLAPLIQKWLQDNPVDAS